MITAIIIKKSKRVGVCLLSTISNESLMFLRIVCILIIFLGLHNGILYKCWDKLIIWRFIFLLLIIIEVPISLILQLFS